MKRVIKVTLASILVLAFFIPISVQANTTNGIDISGNNNVYDYQAIANSNIQYAYVKATESTCYTNPEYIEQFNGLSGIGIKTGFYHFMGQYSDPSEEAEYFYNAIKNYNYQLKPCLDVEVNTRGLSQYQVSQRVLEFCQRFKELSGQDCVVYTGAYFGRDLINNEVKDNYYGWIAHYGVNSPMETGFKLAGHQFSESGSILGISGNVDLDNFNILIGLGGSGTNNVEVDTSTEVTYNYDTCDMIQREKQYVGSRCLELQQLLNRVGYNLVDDGIYGTNTHNVLGQFQQQSGLTADYLAGAQTFSKLYELTSNNSSNWTIRVQKLIGAKQDSIPGPETLSKVQTLKYGSTGELVKLLQERLNFYRFNCGTVDGKMLNKTVAALKAYQRNRGLAADGVCGKISWRQLML